MAIYELRYKASVAKDLRGLPKADVQRILAKAETLKTNPRPPGSEKLSGDEKYRIRQGDYRILYNIYDAQVIVEVIKIGHRKDVYR
ncbi:MAG: type II toxin-antitoxin system RelE/ParE family toxin [Pseudomonadota bacterium]